MKIVCDSKIPFIKGVFEPYSDVLYLSGAQTTSSIVRDADALITRTRTICNSDLLEGSSVRVIASATIGYDHIDTQYCESQHIEWHNAPGCNSASVAQYIASVLCRVALKYQLNFDQLTLGVVGVGNVGRKVARLAHALGMKLLLCDPPRAASSSAHTPAQFEHFVSLEDLLQHSDIVSLHVPLEKSGPYSTYHLIDSARLAQMRADQILINSSRGAVVDNTALLDALATHKIKAAVLDVWEGEPAIDTDLMHLLDFATPHIAGYSTDGKANGSTQAVRAVSQALNLPLTSWQATDLPEPKGGLELSIDAAGLSLQEVITKAILATYDVAYDDALLRLYPQDFEKLRGDYPIRREPSAFTIHLINAPAEYLSTLHALGFNTLTDGVD